MKNKIDLVDLQIVQLLSENAQITYTEIAKTLIISSGTVHARVKKMRDLGFIHGSTMKLNYKVIGWDLTVFLGIHLNQTNTFKDVIKTLLQIPEVVKLHHICGKYDILVKIHARDSDHYRNIYQTRILVIPGIKEIESFISLEESANRHVDFSK
ncbi:MAG: Lrp/AsnC family transcriptional regulator [Flavobacteriaceae bacterium]